MKRYKTILIYLIPSLIYRIIHRSKRGLEGHVIDLNCVDPLGRGALLMSIDSENLQMVESNCFKKYFIDSFINIFCTLLGGTTCSNGLGNSRCPAACY